jgi:hypothetical protein
MVGQWNPDDQHLWPQSTVGGIVMEKKGFLKKDKAEYPCKRWLGPHNWRPSYRWGVAYRIIDENGKDMGLPYHKTKREAREYAKGKGIILIENRRP